MTTKTAYILRGISASGKSTMTEKLLKENPDLVVVSKDKIRKELVPNNPDKNFWLQYLEFDSKIEDKVSSIQSNLIYDCAVNNKSIIIDNTNLHNHKFLALEAHLKTLEFDVQPINLNKVGNINFYLDRNAKRLHSIRPGIINDQYILARQGNLVEPTEHKFIALIDTEYLKHSDYLMLYEILESLLETRVIQKCVFISDEYSYEYSKIYRFLKTLFSEEFDLFCRPSTDDRPVYEVKPYIFDLCVKHHSIHYVFKSKDNTTHLYENLKTLSI